MSKWIAYSIVVITPLIGRAADDTFARRVRPLLDRHCVECHGGSSPKEGLNLESKKTGELVAALRDVQLLDAIAERLRSKTMPPPDNDTPLGDADRKVILDWVDAMIDRSLGGQQSWPSRDQAADQSGLPQHHP